MVTALVTVHFKHGDPFVTLHGASFESPLEYLTLAVMLIFAGPGRLSLDALLFGRSPKAQAVSGVARAS